MKSRDAAYELHELVALRLARRVHRPPGLLHLGTPSARASILEPYGEWGYWYAGEPAARRSAARDGRSAVTRASRARCRRGGSYEKRRFSNVAVWNTVMDTYEYSMARWSEFLAA